MKDFFRHFPPELDEKIALKMIHHKLHKAMHYFKDDKEDEFVECLEKLKDMIEVFLQEVKE